MIFWRGWRRGNKDFLTTKYTEMEDGMFVVTKRNYHGEEAAKMIRWVVHRAGQTRGICECWTAGDAERITAALNNQQPATIN